MQSETRPSNEMSALYTLAWKKGYGVREAAFVRCIAKYPPNFVEYSIALVWQIVL